MRDGPVDARGASGARPKRTGPSVPGGWDWRRLPGRPTVRSPTRERPLVRVGARTVSRPGTPGKRCAPPRHPPSVMSRRPRRESKSSSPVPVVPSAPPPADAESAPAGDVVPAAPPVAASPDVIATPKKQKRSGKASVKGDGPAGEPAVISSSPYADDVAAAGVDSFVPAPAPARDAAGKTKTKGKSKSKAEPKAKADVSAKAVPSATPGAKAKSGASVRVDAKAKTDPAVAPKPKTKAQPKAKAAPAAVAAAVPSPSSDIAPAAPATPAWPAPRTPARPSVSPLVARDGRPVTVVHLAAEVAPIARTGGLGEVVTSLAAYQQAAGIRACIVMPLYRQARAKLGQVELEPVGDAWTTHVAYRDEWSRCWKLPEADATRVLGGHGATGTPELYFLENGHYFDRAGIYGEQGRDYQDNHRRWAHFCAAALRALPRIAGDGPVILHAHDWHAALALAYLRGWYANVPWYRDIATVLTVHNAGYQGQYGAGLFGDFGLPTDMWRMDRFEWYGQVNLLKGGLAFADAATTVSANHATELRTAAGGFGLHATFLTMGDRFVGIANGIDQSRWDPATDPLIPERYSADDLRGKGTTRRALQEALGLPVRADVPIFVMTARLVTQKGLALIVDTPGLFDLDAQWLFLGAGERRFEEALRGIARARPDKVVVDTNFSDAKEHVLMAAGDVCLMPCQYEPCGLTQMRAQRYGTLPLVRRVGGLADTVDDGVTGFTFDQFDTGAFGRAVRRAVGTFHDSATWHRMMLAAMARDFDWGRSEERYRALYRGVLAAR